LVTSNEITSTGCKDDLLIVLVQRAFALCFRSLDDDFLDAFSKPNRHELFVQED